MTFHHWKAEASAFDTRHTDNVGRHGMRHVNVVAVEQEMEMFSGSGALRGTAMKPHSRLGP